MVTEGIVKVADGMQVRVAGAGGRRRGRGAARGRMKLSDLSVKRPVFAAVVAMLIAVVGLIGFFSLSVREYPDVDPPIVSVQTRYIGAAANVVETRVTQVLEEQLAGLEGLQTITSRSRDGQSDITDRVRRRPRRRFSAANDVRDRVGAAAGNLPAEIEPPVVRKVDADAAPIMFLVVSKPGWSRLQLSDWVDRNLVDRFSSIDGVARVFIGGEARPAMRIWLRPERLAGFGLTPADVETALRTQNVELPAGRLELAQQNVTLRVERPFATPEQFRTLIVGRGADGYLVRLGDVARVEQGPENPYAAFRLNGNPAVGLGIVRQSGANTLAVAEAAKAMAEQVRPTLPEGMEIVVGSDELPVHRARDREGLGDARRGGGAGRAGHLPVPRQLAGDPDPGGDRAALPAGELRRALGARLLDQPADPARSGPVDRHRRRRRDRRAREYLSPDRGGRAAARRRL